MESRAEVPPLSLRSPRSLPLMIGNMATGPGRDSHPMIGNFHNSRGAQSRHSPAGNPYSDTRGGAQPIKEKPEKTNNILALGNDPAIFNREPQTRQTSCHYCGLFGSRRCSGCRVTYYCSEECQIRDWKSHSVICKRTTAKVATEEKTVYKGEDSKTFIKPPGPSFSTPGKKEGEGRRVMLSDLKVETLSEGMELQGYVLEFSSPSNFFVQDCDVKSVEKLVQLSGLMNKLYSSPENLRKDYVPEIGEICAAKYSQDQQWYRVLVYNVEISMKIAQVLYLDYGNRETLALSGLQPMHKILDLIPPGAVNVRVAHAPQPPCGWSPECLIDVKRLLMGQKLSFRVVNVDQKELPQYSVEVLLPESGKPLHKVMEEKGYSFSECSKAHSAEEVKPSEVLVEKQKQPHVLEGSPETQGKPGSFRVGDRFEALVTVFHNPEMFFCQSVQNAKQLPELVSAMNARCSTLTTTPLSLPEPGEVCCAQYTADNNWYRASVVKRTSDDTALVGYLDFGNTETLHISRLRPIDSDMLRIPFQAAQCRLAGVKPPSGKWSSETIHKAGLLLTNNVFTAVVVSESAGVLTLDLISNSAEKPVVVSQHLIAAGLAEAANSASVSAPAIKKEEIPREPPSQLAWAQIPVGQEREVMVCMLQSPGDFFCHIYNPADLSSLSDINASLGQFCAQHVSEAYTPIRGDVCGAFFSGDGNWYRGQVKDFTPGGAVKVYFLDYGNTEEVPADKLCKIPSKFLELPFQAIKCSLAGVKPHGDKWDLTATEKFQSAVAGRKLRAKAVSKKENVCSVQLVTSESGESVASVLLGEKVAVPDHSIAEPPPLSSASSPPPPPRAQQLPPRDDYNRPAPKVRIPNDSARRDLQTTECPPASQPAPPVCEDLPNPAVVKQQPSALQEARGVSVAQSWTSVSLPLNEPIEACVLKVRSPDLIYVFPKENRVDAEKLQQVMMDICSYCNAETGQPDYKPSVGDACCAKFAADGQWYRAVVLEVSESMVEIGYADYGNLETLPFSCLRPIRENFLSTPMQITRCRLYDVAPVTHHWSLEGTQSLSNILLAADVVLTAQSAEAGIYAVSIERKKGQEVLDVAEKLVMDGLAKRADTAPSIDVCKEKEGCCCQELRKRVEKLELLVGKMIR